MCFHVNPETVLRKDIRTDLVLENKFLVTFTKMFNSCRCLSEVKMVHKRLFTKKVTDLSGTVQDTTEVSQCNGYKLNKLFLFRVHIPSKVSQLPFHKVTKNIRLRTVEHYRKTFVWNVST